MRKTLTWAIVVVIVCGYLTACGMRNTVPPNLNIKKTYSLSNQSKLPQSLISDLKSNSKVSVCLPTNIPEYDPPMPLGDNMAANLEITSTGYDINLFRRPKGSNTSTYDDADYIGDIAANQTNPKEQIKNLTAPFKYQGKIRLLNGTIALDCTVSNTQNARIESGELITWNNEGWTYIANGWTNTKGTLNATTAVGIANTISKFVHRPPAIKYVERGYIVAVAAGNKLLTEVCWTYNDKEWYWISAFDPNAVLNEASAIDFASFIL